MLSELVANAVRHAGGADVVTFTHADGAVHIEVLDGTTTEPLRRGPGGKDAGGFGINIVTSASRSWGWKPTTNG